MASTSSAQVSYIFQEVYVGSKGVEFEVLNDDI